VHELRQATLQMIELTRNLVEPAGAALLAGAIRLREEVQGRRIALICNGGNISPSELADLLAWDSTAVDWTAWRAPRVS
jgi:threonine dehydratase